MRYSVIAIILVLLVNCQRRTGHDATFEEVDINSGKVHTEDKIEISSKESMKKEPGENTRDWTAEDEYFPVYSFSDKVMGLTFELSYNSSVQNLFVDSVFIYTAQTESFDDAISKGFKNCELIDSVGRFRFYRNLTLEERLLSEVGRSFFVYCARGVVEREIKDVVFSLDECISNIVVFRFDPVDLKRYGYPLFCAKSDLELTYSKLPEMDKEIEIFHRLQNYDYSDSIGSVTFAFRDSVYFSYHDDFHWNKDGDILNYYPGREVYEMSTNGRLHRKWAFSLDLFGIPCD